MDYDEVRGLLERFNGAPNNGATDWLTHRCFDGATSVDKADFATRVAIIDLLWQTHMRCQGDARERLIVRLGGRGDAIRQRLQELQPNDLVDAPTKVFAVAEGAFPVVLDLEGARENFSFATKLFHWMTRSHFPIFDQYARTALWTLQQTGQIHPENAISEKDPGRGRRLMEYAGWINSASEILRAWMSNGWESDLATADRQSLAEPYRFDNSLLRILDKVLYQQGRELTQ